MMTPQDKARALDAVLGLTGIVLVAVGLGLIFGFAGAAIALGLTLIALAILPGGQRK